MMIGQVLEAHPEALLLCQAFLTESQAPQVDFSLMLSELDRKILMCSYGP